MIEDRLGRRLCQQLTDIDSVVGKQTIERLADGLLIHLLCFLQMSGGGEDAASGSRRDVEQLRYDVQA